MRIAEVMRGVGCSFDGVTGDIDVRAVTADSRAVTEGSLFVAVKGHASDGTKFIDEALAKGASCIAAAAEGMPAAGVPFIALDDVRAAIPVIAGNFHGNPSRLLTMAGVTGTNGKTTITYILESIVRSTGREAGVIGTINYRYRDTVVASKNTTPGAADLQAILAAMARAGLDYAVMEVSSHALDQRRVDNVWFDAAICTNITAEHLDYHHTMANYVSAKAKLFGHMKPGGVAVLNNDDTRVAALAAGIRGRVLKYGIARDADVRAKEIALTLDGSRFIVATPGVSFEVRTRLVGMHNVSNILAAVAAALALKININAIKRGIERALAVPGRLEPVDAGQPFKIFVDYAHTEDALFNILSLLRQVKERRIITVFGCGGNRDARKRPAMGKVACELSDAAIITSDNPRHEDPAEIVRQIERGVLGVFSNYSVVLDRREAIARALAMAEAGDIVVIAGKGHEDYQIVKDTVHPFDDREVVRSLLRDRVALS